MNRITLVLSLTFMLATPLCISASQSTPTAEPKTTSDPAARLGSLVSSRDLLLPIFQDTFPEGVPRELAVQLANLDHELWGDLELGIAQTLRQLFDETQLEQLVDFFDSDLGQAWTRASSGISSRILGAMTNHGATIRRLSVVGCVVDSLAPTIENAKKEAGVELPVLPVELLEASLPVAEVVAVTCDCLIGKAIEKWGVESLRRVQGTQEYQTFLEEVSAREECPVPKAPA